MATTAIGTRRAATAIATVRTGPRDEIRFMAVGLPVACKTVACRSKAQSAAGIVPQAPTRWRARRGATEPRRPPACPNETAWSSTRRGAMRPVSGMPCSWPCRCAPRSDDGVGAPCTGPGRPSPGCRATSRSRRWSCPPTRGRRLGSGRSTSTTTSGAGSAATAPGSSPTSTACCGPWTGATSAPSSTSTGGGAPSSRRTSTATTAPTPAASPRSATSTGRCAAATGSTTSPASSPSPSAGAPGA